MKRFPISFWSAPPESPLCNDIRARLQGATHPLPLTVAVAAAPPAGIPGDGLLVIAVADFPPGDCLASFRLPAPYRPQLAVDWLEAMLRRRERSLDSSPPEPAYWARRSALARLDLHARAQAVYPLVDAHGIPRAMAVAVAPNRLLMPDLAPLHLLLPSGSVPLTQAPSASAPSGSVPLERIPLERIHAAAGFALAAVPVTLPWAPASPPTADPAVAAITAAANLERRVTLGWLGRHGQHDLGALLPGTPLFSLDTGALLGACREPFAFAGIDQFASLLPPPPAPEAALESDLALEGSLESRREDYADRNGYNPHFLGVEVPLPKSRLEVKLLAYRNFSVAHLESRKLALFTAVNIDGRRLAGQARTGDPWRFDPRIARQAQLGASFYSGTPLDRGHLVRRLDPVWGANPEQAELDTFHYPNSSPQHRDLNRKSWSDLEDYVYLNARREDLKVTVFTGPVLTPSAPRFKGAQLPEEFWKVVVIRGAGRKPLSATGYLLAQQDMISGLEFAFGEFRTYQVPISLIAAKTGLDFGNLPQYDPKARTGALETAILPALIEQPSDLDLGLEPADAPPGS